MQPLLRLPVPLDQLISIKQPQSSHITHFGTAAVLTASYAYYEEVLVVFRRLVIDHSRRVTIVPVSCLRKGERRGGWTCEATCEPTCEHRRDQLGPA
jgi:hypothetical protein